MWRWLRHSLESLIGQTRLSGFREGKWLRCAGSQQLLNIVYQLEHGIGEGLIAVLLEYRAVDLFDESPENDVGFCIRHHYTDLRPQQIVSLDKADREDQIGVFGVKNDLVMAPHCVMSAKSSL